MQVTRTIQTNPHAHLCVVCQSWHKVSQNFCNQPMSQLVLLQIVTQRTHLAGPAPRQTLVSGRWSPASGCWQRLAGSRARGNTALAARVAHGCRKVLSSSKVAHVEPRCRRCHMCYSVYMSKVTPGCPHSSHEHYTWQDWCLWIHCENLTSHEHDACPARSSVATCSHERRVLHMTETCHSLMFCLPCWPHTPREYEWFLWIPEWLHGPIDMACVTSGVLGFLVGRTFHMNMTRGINCLWDFLTAACPREHGTSRTVFFRFLSARAR
jgi:hypothetical protein